MHVPLDTATLAQLFTEARTHNVWTDRPVEDALLQRAYELAALGPTSMNCEPARFVFVKGEAAKARLLPTLSPGNVEKTKTAPVTVIVAMDTKFYEHLPQLFPHMPTAKDMFAGNAELAKATAFRNSTLTGAYFMLALRSLGLDCGGMSGFDPAKLNAEFFPDGRYQANFLINVGYGDASKLFPRQPRLSFEQAVTVL
jgi:3-hydroxypropanoate dehydrogenase